MQSLLVDFTRKLTATLIATFATFAVMALSEPTARAQTCQESGEARVWFMNGTALDHQAAITPTPDPGWALVGVGDFNGDGKPDLVWQRENNQGEARVWFMNGTALDHQAAITPNPDSGPWQVVGVGDFNGDGKADLVWRRRSCTSAQLDDSSSGCYFASTSCYGVVEVCHYVCNLHPENNSSSVCGACIGLHF